MSCSFYCFKNNDYYCMKKSDYVDSDCYYRYCRGYSYDECPIYKGPESGGCYITTACVQALKCSDDGYELNLLRNYRDTFLIKQSYGESAIEDYYKYAPLIVKKINLSNEAVEKYKRIYKLYIKPCVEMIEQGNLNECYLLYRKMFYELKNKYLTEGKNI